MSTWRKTLLGILFLSPVLGVLFLKIHEDRIDYDTTIRLRPALSYMEGRSDSLSTFVTKNPKTFSSVMSYSVWYPIGYASLPYFFSSSDDQILAHCRLASGISITRVLFVLSGFSCGLCL